VEKKYLKYTIEDFTQDKQFINWVKRNENHEQWNYFLQNNPELNDRVEIARKIVQSLQSAPIHVYKETMQSVWNDIDKFYVAYHKSNRRIKVIKQLFRYAAVFVLLLTLGSVVLYYYDSQNGIRFSETDTTVSASNDAKLILPGGEEIVLNEQQTNLEFDSEGEQVKIDKDTIIDYKIENPKDLMAEVIIPYGKRSQIKLPDGSKVWLNAGSKLIFPQKFTGKERHVFLKGEAYFDVVKNVDARFVVTLDKIDVIVHGTEFNMNDRNYDDELEIVLVEGGISLKENNVINIIGKEIKLLPNQKAVYSKNKILVESDIDVSYYTSWKDGVVEFRGDNIANVFSQLSKYYNVNFVTEKSVELNRNISGKLDLEKSLEEVMEVVAEATPITYRIEDNTVYVNSKINN